MCMQCRRQIRHNQFHVGQFQLTILSTSQRFQHKYFKHWFLMFLASALFATIHSRRCVPMVADRPNIFFSLLLFRLLAFARQNPANESVGGGGGGDDKHEMYQFLVFGGKKIRVRTEYVRFQVYLFFFTFATRHTIGLLMPTMTTTTNETREENKIQKRQLQQQQ